MKRLFLVMLLVCFFCGVSDAAQTNKWSSASLENTTWRIFYRDCKMIYDNYSKNKWIDYDRSIILLKNGKVKVKVTGKDSSYGDWNSSYGDWKFKNNRLRLSIRIAGDIYISDLNVTVKGNTMVGTADLDMNPKPFCVKLIR